MYEVIFFCSNANYFWNVEEGLSLEEATRLVEIKNSNEKIHGSCCQYYIQKQLNNN